MAKMLLNTSLPSKIILTEEDSQANCELGIITMRDDDSAKLCNDRCLSSST